MEELKEHWIREVEEVVTADMKPLSKDDEETDQIDNDDDFNSPDANATSYIGAAFDNNSIKTTPQVSFDLVLDDSHSNPVDTMDHHVNFNTSPFPSTIDMSSFNGYDLVSQATGMSDFAVQQFGDHNMYQTFDENNFVQHLVPQESFSSQMW
jgi:hypothetical protein